MAFDLLTIGDFSIDQFMHVSSAEVTDGKICFSYGSKIPIETYRANIAGNACNNIISCNKLGLKCAVYSEIGADPNGNKFIETFDKAGINRELVVQDPANPTNVHTLIVHEAERTIFSYHSKRFYDLERVRAFFSNQGKPKWIYYTSLCPNFHEFQHALAQYLKQNMDIGLAFNPGSFHMKEGVDSLRNILERVDILFVNTDEAQRLTKSEAAGLEMHKKLQELGPKLSVITDGKNGSSAYDGSSFEEMGILPPENLVDKTGAGDAHSAGFLSAVFYGKNLREALLWGTLNSSHVIRKVGSVHGLLTLDEISELSSNQDVLKSIS